MAWFDILKNSEDTVQEILAILDDYAELQSGRFNLATDGGDYFNVEINPTEDNLEDLIAATELLLDEWPEQQKMMRIYLASNDYSDLQRVVSEYSDDPEYWLDRMKKDTPKLKALISRLKAEMRE
mgnify:CR=1 FL=1